MAVATKEKTFFGYKYDTCKLEKLQDKIHDNYSVISEMNSHYCDINGGADHYSVCNLCGKIIVTGHDGYGSKCYKTVVALAPVVAKINPVFSVKLSEYNLKVWILYTNVIRDMYIRINSKADGTLKNFKSEFKKSFVPSIMKAEKISKKQVDVMLRDIDNYSNYNDNIYTGCLEDKMEVIRRNNEDTFYKLCEEWHNLISGDNSVKLFAQITYANAWINNPLVKQVQFDD